MKGISKSISLGRCKIGQHRIPQGRNTLNPHSKEVEVTETTDNISKSDPYSNITTDDQTEIVFGNIEEEDEDEKSDQEVFITEKDLEKIGYNLKTYEAADKNLRNALDTVIKNTKTREQKEFKKQKKQMKETMKKTINPLQNVGGGIISVKKQYNHKIGSNVIYMNKDHRGRHGVISDLF